MTNSNALLQSDSDAFEITKKLPRSTLVSRNITVAGRRTSVRLEPEMWDGLREISQRERANLHKICTSIALQKSDPTSLTAAIRVYVMSYFRSASTEDGHSKAGHGYGLTLGMTMARPAGYNAAPSSAPAMLLTKRSFA